MANNSAQTVMNSQRAGMGLRHLSDTQIEKIHRASLDILERTGVTVAHEQALEMLKAAGARVEGQRVYMPADMVEAAVASAPDSIDIFDQAGALAMQLAPYASYFGTGSDLPSTIDPETGAHRSSTKADVVRATRLCDGLDNIDFCMSMAIASDASEVTSYVHEFDAMVRSTAKPLVFTANDKADMQDIFELACQVVDDAQELMARPRYILYNEPISPLYHSLDGVDKLFFAAEHNIPVIYIASPMMGGSAPVTMAGCIAQASAESLSGLVIHQLVRKGSSFIYSADATILDMQEMIFSYGSPELQLMDAAFADMAHHYGLPLFCIAGATDSKVIDAQAGAEMALSLLISALNGCNIIHDVGYLESGLCSSSESIVLADELIGYAKRFLGTYEIADETLALEVINEVGPSGHFLEQPHTLSHYKDDVWRPEVFNRQPYENWFEAGGKPITEALRNRAKDILDNQKPPTLSTVQIAAMDAILARRG